MSGSAICFTENPKITAASRNMHMTGKEKSFGRQTSPGLLVAVRAVSDCGESDAIGKTGTLS